MLFPRGIVFTALNGEVVSISGARTACMLKTEDIDQEVSNIMDSVSKEHLTAEVEVYVLKSTPYKQKSLINCFKGAGCSSNEETFTAALSNKLSERRALLYKENCLSVQEYNQKIFRFIKIKPDFMFNSKIFDTSIEGKLPIPTAVLIVEESDEVGYSEGYRDIKEHSESLRNMGILKLVFLTKNTKEQYDQRKSLKELAVQVGMPEIAFFGVLSKENISKENLQQNVVFKEFSKKRFLLMGSESHGGSGGMNDILFGYNTPKEALDKLNSEKSEGLFNIKFYQIVNMENRTHTEFNIHKHELESYLKTEYSKYIVE